MPSTRTPARKTKPAQRDDHSIVAVDKFILATRDSGYKGTASAIAELVDNSIQAGATTIEILVEKTGEDPRYPLEVWVCDNGCGMDPRTLRQALRFGGSSRFGDRSGLGRYGMGLPNSSLSQARRVEVTSWTSRREVYRCELDLEAIATGHVTKIPPPRRAEYPFEFDDQPPTGTVVAWRLCDRLDHRRISTLARKLETAIGRRFRCFLWEDVEVFINGTRVTPIDPLYINPEARIAGAQIFGDPILYELRAAPDEDCREVGVVEVTFSELPVMEWHKLPNHEKRRLGISKGAGVSIVRGRREVDHGWFFMGTKRRENYDDWWRCEIRFDPVLDEAFGITHTKQQIRPQAHVLEALEPDLEATARVLNSRARKQHLLAKVDTKPTLAEKIAAVSDTKLAPLPAPRQSTRNSRLLGEVRKQLPALGEPPAARGTADYRVVVAPSRGSAGRRRFVECVRDGGRLIAVIDPDHPFYERVYKSLEGSEHSRDQEFRAVLDLMLLSLSREVARLGAEDQATLNGFLDAWTRSLATMLNEKK